MAKYIKDLKIEENATILFTAPRCKSSIDLMEKLKSFDDLLIADESFYDFGILAAKYRVRKLPAILKIEKGKVLKEEGVSYIKALEFLK